jgi:hypothetical protein
MLAKHAPKLITVVLILLIIVPLALASAPRITDIIVTNNQEHLLVYFNVQDCFTQEMNRAILSGIPTTFTYYIELSQTRTFWPNKKLISLKVQHTVKYDALKEEFKITLSEKKNQTITVKEFFKVQELMADVSNIQVYSLNKMEKNQYYQLRLKAELDKFKLPFYLHYIFFFVSLWDFETSWYTVDFTY